MAGNYTVVPQTAETDNEYIGKTSDGKLTAGDKLIQDIGEHEIEIIELQANASVSPLDHDSTISDTFSVEAGYNGSVDTTNTDLSYVDGLYSQESKIIFDSRTDHPSRDTYVEVKKACKLVAITFKSAGTVNSDYRILINSDIIYTKYLELADGDIVTLRLSQPVDLKIGDIVNLSADNSYAMYYDSANMTVNDYFIQSIEGGYISASGYFSIIEPDANGKVICETGEISGTVTAVALITDTPVTFNITDGVTTQSGLTTNTKIESSLASNPSKIEIIPDASVKTYCLKVWK